MSGDKFSGLRCRRTDCAFRLRDRKRCGDATRQRAGGNTVSKYLAGVNDCASTQPASLSATATTTPATTQPALMPTSNTAARPATQPSTNPTTAATATTSPTTQPLASATTAPAVGGGIAAQPGSGLSSYESVPQILPREYSILAVRSIFQKGSHVTRGFDIPARSAPASSSPSASAAALAAASAAPEESLVFEGAMETANQYLAFVEDRNAGKMLMLQSGARIARGKITDITLDTLDYSVDGAVLHVQVGQNLRGETATAVRPTVRARQWFAQGASNTVGEPRRDHLPT